MTTHKPSDKVDLNQPAEIKIKMLLEELQGSGRETRDLQLKLEYSLAILLNEMKLLKIEINKLQEQSERTERKHNRSIRFQIGRVIVESFSHVWETISGLFDS